VVSFGCYALIRVTSSDRVDRNVGCLGRGMSSLQEAGHGDIGTVLRRSFKPAHGAIKGRN